MDNSRTGYVKKNIFYSYISIIATSILQVVCRTIFVYTLGAGYLGVSGLFTNVLGVLSFAELGIGSAIVFSLYKPIAENNKERIKSLLQLYKRAYRLIALIVFVVGLLISPFLEYLVNTDIPLSQITVYYYIFLFNTVTSYFLTYKTSYVTAIQKDYIVSIANTVASIVTGTVQIILLLLGGDYLGYLLVAAFIGLLQKIITVIYLNNKFPFLVEGNIEPLDKETKDSIWKNVRALVIHKIGDVSVHQTDNIIISVFVSTTSVGVISNYTTINAIISTFTNKFFNAFVASFGNMLAKEGVEKQRKIFDIYDMLGFWIYGFVLISFVTLSQPFITLWLGEDLLIDDLTMILYFVSQYLAGMTFIPYNFKVAAGKFNEDKWVAFAQAIMNLVVSIVAIKIMGLPGVYVGTIVSRMIVVIVRPYIIYKYVLRQNVMKYYFRLIFRSIIAFMLCFGMWALKSILMPEVTIIRFIAMCFLTAIIPNIVFFVLFGRSEEFKDVLSRINFKRKVKKCK